MNSHGQRDKNRLDTASAPQAGGDHPVAEIGVPDAAGVVTARTWGLVLAAGIAAGVCSWLATEGVLKAYMPALMPPMKPMPTDEDARLTRVARIASGTAAFGAMGGLLGLTLGLAGGASRRSVRAAGMAGTVGLLAGSALAAGTTWTVLGLVYTMVDPQSHDLVIPLLYHEAMWSIPGALGGLMFGLGAGGRDCWKRTMIGGWAGAALATVVYELVGALAFPTHRTQLPLAGSVETRALAPVLVALGAAIGTVMAARDPRKKPQKR
jgi:hypothetical protein